MKIGREELEDLKEGLEKLTHFIRVMEGVKLPDFYRYFDAMKNNINIFFYAGCEDIEDFFPILERDWKASHTMFIGVQNYDLGGNIRTLIRRYVCILQDSLLMWENILNGAM